MRNSWGSYWGMNGFAKVMMHKVSVMNAASVCHHGICTCSSLNKTLSQCRQISNVRMFNGPSIVN